MLNWLDIFARLQARIETYGIRVIARPLGSETTGTFDGLSITVNTRFDPETWSHNAAHSFGHIVQWSVDTARQRQLYDRLYAAKARKQTDPAGLEAALADFRRYEEEASGYAHRLLLATDNVEALPAFTNFGRADIECIVGYHRDGIAPIWHDFFANWNHRVAVGELLLEPFRPLDIPDFKPLLIAEQEVIQEVDGRLNTPS